MNNPKLPVPTFKLYGETHPWSTPDLMHLETIFKRSSVHQWEIKPHRHQDLLQLLYIQRGVAVVELEGEKITLNQPTIQVIPQLCVHGFRFEENVEGYVMTLATPLIKKIENHLGIPLTMLSVAGSYPTGEDGAIIEQLFHLLHKEYESAAPAREKVLHATIDLLMAWIGRHSQINMPPSDRLERRQVKVSEFMQLVEQHYRNDWLIERYAKELNISTVYLNQICRQVSSHTALEIVHQRLLLEAKRSLLYTVMTVSQVSDYLGFSDPTYFSRFFKRLTGLAPKDYRRHHANKQTGLIAPSSDN